MKKNNIARQVGFSHGVLYKIHNIYSRENIQLFKNCGCNAIEINYHKAAEGYDIDKIVPFVKDFQYISMHAPCDWRYANNTNTRALLKFIERVSTQLDAKLVVIHPDLVDDWKVFDDYKIAWAIENMDDRKECFKKIDDLKEFFSQHNDWGLVLDLGHVNVNDKTMGLADEMIANFRSKIWEIHLSGYETFHDPLYRTKQIEIIERCQQLEVPVIIESTFEVSDGIEGVEKEFNYIVKNLT